MIRVVAIMALALTFSGGAGCSQACPAALLEGVLAAEAGDLVVVPPDGVAQRVDWAVSGHRVRDAGGTLVVVDRFGLIAARQGDFVRLGGGESARNRWHVCGLFEAEDPARAQQLITLTEAA